MPQRYYAAVGASGLISVSDDGTIAFSLIKHPFQPVKNWFIVLAKLFAIRWSEVEKQRIKDEDDGNCVASVLLIVIEILNFV